MDTDYLIYLLKYDSMHGRFEGDIKKVEGGIEVNGQRVRVYHETDPAKIQWGAAGAHYVAESSGAFTAKDKAGLHLQGGA